MKSAVEAIGSYLDENRSAYRCVDCLVDELPQLKLDDVQAAFEDLSSEIHPFIHSDASAECGLCMETKPVVFVV